MQGASPVRLVILLYEQMIEDLRRALAAQVRGDIEGRTRGINHANLVLSHLQSTLDKGRGGQVATNLEHFYGHLRAGLTEAQARQSTKLLEEQISLVMQVHDAWLQVERAAASAVDRNAVPGNETPSFKDWNA